MNLVTRVNPPLVKCAGRRCWSQPHIYITHLFVVTHVSYGQGDYICDSSGIH